jgi:hypothetical protein
MLAARHGVFSPSTALAKIDAQTTFQAFGIDAFRCTAGATKFF